MARSMARPALSHDDDSRFWSKDPGKFEDSWPDEPTAVDATMTMEEMIVDEMRRQGALPAPANDPKKGTLVG
jgi:hypothetical protein